MEVSLVHIYCTCQAFLLLINWQLFHLSYLSYLSILLSVFQLVFFFFKIFLGTTAKEVDYNNESTPMEKSYYRTSYRLSSYINLGQIWCTAHEALQIQFLSRTEEYVATKDKKPHPLILFLYLLKFMVVATLNIRHPRVEIYGVRFYQAKLIIGNRYTIFVGLLEIVGFSHIVSVRSVATHTHFI